MLFCIISSTLVPNAALQMPWTLPGPPECLYIASLQNGFEVP